MRTGTVMVMLPPESSCPMLQVTASPTRVQVPVAAGSVLLQVMSPVTSVPASSVSVTLVLSESPGPALLTTISQLNGSRRVMGAVTVAPPFLGVLVMDRSTRRRTVVGSVAVLSVTEVSVSLAETTALLLKMSPFGAGSSSASKRRKTLLVAPIPRSLRARPVAKLSLVGSPQVKFSAVPGSDSVPRPVQSGVGLQVLPPKVVTSQTNFTRLPAGGVMVSSIVTPVAKDPAKCLTSSL